MKLKFSKEFSEAEVAEITKDLEWYHLTRELRRRGCRLSNDGRVNRPQPMERLQAALIQLVDKAIGDSYYTASATRVMLSLDELIELGCATEAQWLRVAEKIREFNEKNATQGEGGRL